MPASDQLVTAKTILQAQLELQRLGHDKALAALEHTEPDLAEVVIENTTAIYHQALDAGASPRHARRIHQDTVALVLLCIQSLQRAHANLWAEGDGKAVRDKLEPPAPPSRPPEPPSIT
jgi:hypothetical protein